MNMRRVLHIVTASADPAEAGIIAAQRKLPNHEVRVCDLTQPEPDYRALLEEIFAADSIAVW